MKQKSIWNLFYSTLIALLFFGSVAAEEIRLPYRGITLNGNLMLAPGRTLQDEVILIIHGTQGHNKLELIEQLQQLFLDKGHSTLAISLSLGVDNRHGLYDCTIPSTYRHADAIDEIGAWVDWLKTRGAHDVVLLGHSRGGDQSAWFAVEHDQPVIKSLVLLAPAASTSDKEESEAYQKRFGKPLEPVLKKAQALVKAGKGNTKMKHVPFLLLCGDTTVTAESFVSHYGPDPRRDTLYWLPKLVKPALVVVAGADEINPSLAKRVAPLADGKLIQAKVVDGSDHFFRDLNADDAVDAAITFIDSTKKASSR